jgi:hypothetical protein
MCISAKSSERYIFAFAESPALITPFTKKLKERVFQELQYLNHTHKEDNPFPDLQLMEFKREVLDKYRGKELCVCLRYRYRYRYWKISISAIPIKIRLFWVLT